MEMLDPAFQRRMQSPQERLARIAFVGKLNATAKAIDKAWHYRIQDVVKGHGYDNVIHVLAATIKKGHDYECTDRHAASLIPTPSTERTITCNLHPAFVQEWFWHLIKPNLL